MGYQELMKSMVSVRKYVREFYVYGYKQRNELIDSPSQGRAYDDDRRKIESIIGEDMIQHIQSSSGRARISIDSREVVHNPLYKLFKAKSCPDSYVLLHFCLLNVLSENKWKSLDSIVVELHDIWYWKINKKVKFPSSSTVSARLKNYVDEGLVLTKTEGNKNLYKKAVNVTNLTSWADAVDFFSEMNPMGVIGSFILDKRELSNHKSHFWYKHHFLLHAIDSEILELLLEAIKEKRYVEIHTRKTKNADDNMVIVPIKVYVSTQNGREYVVCHEVGQSKIKFIRIDGIVSATIKGYVCNYEEYENEYMSARPYLWGVIAGNSKDVVHFEMILSVGEHDDFIVKRLEREKRNGSVYKLNASKYKYVVDTYDAMELMPWVRTFIGRIEKIECTNKAFEKKFYKDMDAMYDAYLGGDEDDI